MKRKEAIRIVSHQLKQYSKNNQIKNINSIFDQVTEEVTDELCKNNEKLNNYLNKVNWKRFCKDLKKWYQ